MSSANVARVRLRPEERRVQIVGAAAAIAIEHGLERVTIRSIANRLGVRPGLISHYFPVAEALVAEAFVRAAADERAHLLPDGGDPRRRLVAFLAATDGPDAQQLARLWLNARHLARYSPLLEAALDEQEALDRERLTSLVAEGVLAGAFEAEAETAAIRIWIAVDGRGAYANSRPFASAAYDTFVIDTAAWALGLDAVALAREVAAARS